MHISVFGARVRRGRVECEGDTAFPVGMGPGWKELPMLSGPSQPLPDRTQQTVHRNRGACSPVALPSPRKRQSGVARALYGMLAGCR